MPASSTICQHFVAKLDRVRQAHDTKKFILITEVSHSNLAQLADLLLIQSNFTSVVQK